MINTRQGFLWGFVHAFRGVRLASRGRNMRVHLAAAAVVAALLALLAVTGAHLAVVIVTVFVVLGFEAMNTAVELLCDLVSESLNLIYPDERIRNIKDVSAGAVLFVAVGAALVGAVIFRGPLI